ncbi:hypothetical protein [Gloeocapsopsis dulcis]|uniref:hypothetical protein n=1 Tax=Gloeocapsopsis dulcis TaxID=2859516 RepID=UPI0018C796C6|nr:hypothetical protein [Gloeocapsopsis dulcis]WNN87681.1 hypothetical protein P0S91_15305 [Gloeocapsopsis dulcis]
MYKSLSELDYQFLAASQECDRREVEAQLKSERIKEIEARLLQEQKVTQLQKLFLATLSLILAIALIGITFVTSVKHC